MVVEIIATYYSSKTFLRKLIYFRARFSAERDITVKKMCWMRLRGNLIGFIIDFIYHDSNAFNTSFFYRN